MKLPLLLLLIQSCALVARATPARHWRRAPTHGVFNVDVYAYNKPRMNLVRRQAHRKSIHSGMLPFNGSRAAADLPNTAGDPPSRGPTIGTLTEDLESCQCNCCAGTSQRAEQNNERARP
ncbi:GM22042 [Drosophila sechellia]|uniref:GM22042 n=1 Tax=Drosophila sechellia TaxID=7238 RepID=B4HQP3_DROSE|nr:GM22042 [Drosophila sechellia]